MRGSIQGQRCSPEKIVREATTLFDAAVKNEKKNYKSGQMRKR